MAKGILTINAGSSSIKFAVFESNGALAAHPGVSGQIDGIGASARLEVKDHTGRHEIALNLSGDQENQHRAALDFLLSWFTEHESAWEIIGVGHRVVHGGEHYAAPIVLDPAMIDALARFIPLAPLHQPHNLNGVRALTALLPTVPQIACFDTAFHRSNPAIAQMFAVPRWVTAEGVRRYGFHGLSYEYIARVLPEHLGDKAGGRVVVAHLGNGSSMCGMVGGKSIASSMGFTPLDGLMMGTRPGNIDPGVLLYLMDNKGMDSAAIAKLLYKESGLLGVSGLSQDMRTLLAAGTPEAEEAIDLYCYRIVRELGSIMAAIGGLDALVFTGGIGEHAAEIRRRVGARLGWLETAIDDQANAANALDIARSGSRVAIRVIPTNEEWMIAHHTQVLISHH
ncbi:MAG TPA: acetate/propionate family kinase [Rhodocyclaceae bacterium]|nr:acetate/propionate family kinase [Rhodocyclaceae bacterium]